MSKSVVFKIQKLQTKHCKSPVHGANSIATVIERSLKGLDCFLILSNMYAQ